MVVVVLSERETASRGCWGFVQMLQAVSVPPFVDSMVSARYADGSIVAWSVHVRCLSQDKNLRKMLYEHIVSDIKSINEKGRNPKVKGTKIEQEE